MDVANFATSRSGIPTYDRAQWRPGAPRTSHAHHGTSMSAILQLGLDTPAGDVDVPPLDALVLITRFAPAADLDYRLADWRNRVRTSRGFHIVIPPGVETRWTTSAGGHDGWFHLHLSRFALGRVEEELGASLERPFAGFDEQLLTLVRVAKELAGHDDVQALAWDSLAMMVGCRLATLLEHQPSGGQRFSGGLAPWQARRAIEYLDVHFARQVTLDELAAAVGLSAFHFARSFARTVGQPPHRFQQALRLEHAVRLLADPRLSIAEIADQIGFTSPQAFTRMFRRRMGVAPSHYRAAIS